jgi:hypothetical protein
MPDPATNQAVETPIDVGDCPLGTRWVFWTIVKFVVDGGSVLLTERRAARWPALARTVTFRSGRPWGGWKQGLQQGDQLGNVPRCDEPDALVLDLTVLVGQDVTPALAAEDPTSPGAMTLTEWAQAPRGGPSGPRVAGRYRSIAIR